MRNWCSHCHKAWCEQSEDLLWALIQTRQPSQRTEILRESIQDTSEEYCNNRNICLFYAFHPYTPYTSSNLISINPPQMLRVKPLPNILHPSQLTLPRRLYTSYLQITSIQIPVWRKIHWQVPVLHRQIHVNLSGQTAGIQVNTEIAPGWLLSQVVASWSCSLGRR